MKGIFGTYEFSILKTPRDIAAAIGKRKAAKAEKSAGKEAVAK